MKNRKVLNVRSHVGGVHGKNSYDSVKDKADMEITPVGVLVRMPGKTEILIPWPNCTEVALAPETEVSAESEKRGPGRPPGPRAA